LSIRASAAGNTIRKREGSVDTPESPMNTQPDRRSLLLCAAATLIMAAAPASAAETLRVVASFSILGDLTANIGGGRIALTTLVGPQGDGHVYQPTPADGKAMAEAKLVIANGLNFEGWMERLVKASGTKATLIEASKGIKARAMEEEGHDHEAGESGHDHGAFDPHAWQSVSNVKTYIANIRDALVAADPAGKPVYEANAADYLSKLDSLDAEIKAEIAGIPEARRKIITSHDAFGYFGAAYGLDFVAPQGVSTEAEVSAKGVARIIRQIRKQNIPAIFVENISDPRMMQRISDETGAKIGGTLYSDALSDDKGPAATYIDMMRHNVRELTTALTN
jgi:zinc/manganese transport system substrate-binding protein